MAAGDRKDSVSFLRIASLRKEEKMSGGRKGGEEGKRGRRGEDEGPLDT